MIAKASFDLFNQDKSEADSGPNMSDISDNSNSPPETPIRRFVPLKDEVQEFVENEMASNFRKKITIFNNFAAMNVELENFLYQVRYISKIKNFISIFHKYPQTP